MLDRYDFPEVRFAHLQTSLPSVQRFKRIWSASRRGLNALDMIAILPNLLSVIATVAYTKVKLERIMGF